MACLLKQSKYQKYVLKTATSHQLMTKNKMQTLLEIYSKLPSDIVKRLSTAKNILGENSVEKYYWAMNIPSNFF